MSGTKFLGKCTALFLAGLGILFASHASAQEMATNQETSVIDAQPESAATNQPNDQISTMTPAKLTEMMRPQPAPKEAPPMAAELGQMSTPGVIQTNVTIPIDVTRVFQTQLQFARKFRTAKEYSQAAQTLIELLKTNAPLELKRPVLFELALVAQDEKQLIKAQQIFSQYLHLYEDDPSVPEVLLRQGLIYREMGVTELAISKFYSVMSTSLKLKLDKLDYYKKLVLQAQIEIANTYFLEGKYAEAADYFSRLLRNPPPDLDKAQIEFKLIQALSGLTNCVECIARGQVFVENHTNSPDVPEVRFLLATNLKKLGRNQESLKQVLLLLQSQRENVQKNPEVWAYWQKRAGNEIAAQLAKDGDSLEALEIYLALAELDDSAAWQLPVWYQTGLVYEQLQQPAKAGEYYRKMLDRQKDATATGASPSLLSLLEMAKWRNDYLAWLEKAKTTGQTYQGSSASNRPAADTVATQ